MMRITTSSSTRVKPRLSRERAASVHVLSDETAHRPANLSASARMDEWGRDPRRPVRAPPRARRGRRRGRRPGRASRAAAAAIAAQPRVVEQDRVDRGAQPLGRERGVGDHGRRAALLHPARVGGLVVGGGVRIRDQHRRQAVLRELEDRAARAGHGEVGGRERLAERAQVVAQVVVRAGRGQVGEVAPAGDVEDAIGRIRRTRRRRRR